MGILRVYLALCVVAEHAGRVLPWQMHEGRQAVQIFYIISGFYMALVLSSRYSKPRDFYVSRFLRIFPTYWVALAVTIVLSVAFGLVFNRWLLLSAYTTHPFDRNGAAGVMLAALSNFTLIGQDWVMFLQNEIGHPLRFTTNFMGGASPLYHYLLIPQCWSIGVELTFYALAPFLNRLSSSWLACIAVGAFAARLIGYWTLGLAHDPWTYRFFPFEISPFLFGMLGYRLYAQALRYNPPQRWRLVSWSSLVIGAAVVLLLMYFRDRGVHLIGRFVGRELAVLVTYPLFIVVVPVLFFVFGNHKFDRLIGELSYPIYLIHLIIFFGLVDFLTCVGIAKATGVIVAIVSIGLSALIYRVVIAPLDNKRHLLTIKSPQPTEVDRPGSA